MRAPILIGGLVLVGALAALTISVIVQNGLDPLTVISLLIVGMLGIGLAGALHEGEDEDDH